MALYSWFQTCYPIILQACNQFCYNSIAKDLYCRFNTTLIKSMEDCIMKLSIFKKLATFLIVVTALATTSISASAYETNKNNCTTLGWNNDSATYGGYSFSTQKACDSYAEINYDDISSVGSKAFTIPNSTCTGKIIAVIDRDSIQHAYKIADIIHKNGLIYANGKKSSLQIGLEIAYDYDYNPQFIIRAYDPNHPDFIRLINNNISSYKVYPYPYNGEVEIVLNIDNYYFPGLKVRGTQRSESFVGYNFGRDREYAKMASSYSFYDDIGFNTFESSRNIFTTKYTGSKNPSVTRTYAVTIGNNTLWSSTHTFKSKSEIYTAPFQYVVEPGNSGNVYKTLSTNYKYDQFIGCSVNKNEIDLYLGAAYSAYGTDYSGNPKNAYHNAKYYKYVKEKIQEIQKAGYSTVTIRYYDNCYYAVCSSHNFTKRSLGSVTVKISDLKY